MHDAGGPTVEGRIPSAYELAWKRLEPRIRAVAVDELVARNVDGSFAVSVAFAAAPRVAPLREEMSGLGALLDFSLVDEVLAFGEAFLHVNASFVSLTTPKQSLAELAEEGTRLRALMLASQQVLQAHGLVRGVFPHGLKGPVGYRNLSHDLGALAQFYRKTWAIAGTRTPLTPNDVARAAALASELFYRQAAQRLVPKEMEAMVLLRRQAFTLFMRAYDEVRRAVTFLRWRHGDAEEIAPSVFGARMKLRQPSTTREEEAEELQEAQEAQEPQEPQEPQASDEVVAAGGEVEAR